MYLRQLDSFQVFTIEDHSSLRLNLLIMIAQNKIEARLDCYW